MGERGGGLFEDIDIFIGVLHVVLLADYALHCLFVGVKGVVEVAVIVEGVSSLADAGFEFGDAAFLLYRAQQGVFIEEEHERAYHQ